MQDSYQKYLFVFSIHVIIIGALLFTVTGCSREPAWKSLNEKVIKEYGITARIRNDIPKTGVASNLEPGVVTNIKNIPEVEIAPGIRGRMYWGTGILVTWMTLKPEAEIPEETLPSERIMIVMKGSVEQLINGSFVTMKAAEADFSAGKNRLPVKEFVYLEKGAVNAVKAGKEGADLLEIYRPVRLDYLKKTGIEKIPANVPDDTYDSKPSIEPNTVYDFYDVQFTEFDHGANSRLISGSGELLSFLRMDPGLTLPRRFNPEEQITIVLRGWMEKIVPGRAEQMEEGDIIYLPGGMVHRDTVDSLGCDVLDVFWPVRPDYIESMEKNRPAYHAIIPEDARVELVVDGSKEGPGILYSEGPTWMNGKLYFSSFFFDHDYHGDPELIAYCEMDPDGTYRHIFKESTNGTMAIGNGNIAVVIGLKRQIVELTPTGKIVRKLAYGDAITRPNDLVLDGRGGIYFTDHRGRCAFYMNPDKELIRIIDPLWHGMINGILLSPDGKVLYASNTSGKFVYAYDVKKDGTVSNEREFAELHLPPHVLDRGSKGSGADGMTMDVKGNIYVSTAMGIQIFSPKGEFIGIVNFPVQPLNCCFGDDDMQTLYATCYDRIYRIRTNVRGYEYRLYK